MTRTTPKPLWDEVPLPKFSPISSSGRFDAVIIGGGITGLSAAYLLKRAGRKVCLLERNAIGTGDTGCTTAHLTQVTDARLPRLVKVFGREEAALAWYGGAAACDLIEQIVSEQSIHCLFRRVPAFLHASLEHDRDERQELEDEAALARQLGFDAEYVDEVPLVDQPGIRFRDQAKFHPRAYLAGLARAVDGGGSRVCEQSEVSEVQDDPPMVIANGVCLESDRVIVASHVPLVGGSSFVKASLLHSKLAPYSSYVVSGKTARGTAGEMTLWDTSDPYYYLRIDREADGDRLIFGGNDHKTGQADDTAGNVERLERTLLRVVPDVKVDYHWSGQVIETNDGLPFIGETSRHQFVATGFAGNGMTFGTLAGLMARDWVLGSVNPWQELFSVDRKSIRGGTWDYIKENLDYPYYYVADRLATRRSDTSRAVQRGSGMVQKLDGKPVACFRDEAGKVHRVSAVCTHMGCLVRWNSAEQTWDCPCHGSRFGPDGEVMAGPGETALEVP